MAANNSWVPSVSSTPIDTGVWANLPVMTPDANGDPYKNGANAYVQYGNEVNGLWLYDVSADFTLNGSIAQGPLTQDFYPHNLANPSITFKGQTPNSYEKLRLATFIRNMHVKSLITSTGANQDTVLLAIKNKGQKHARTQKGSPSNFHIYGIIENFDFSIERFTTAYDYSFTFVISFTTQQGSDSGSFLTLNLSQSAPVQLMNINGWSANVENSLINAQLTQTANALTAQAQKAVAVPVTNSGRGHR